MGRSIRNPVQSQPEINSPWPVHSSGSFFALKRQHAFPRPHQEQSPETFPQGCQQSLPVNYDWDSTNVWVSVCIQSALSMLKTKNNWLFIYIPECVWMPLSLYSSMPAFRSFAGGQRVKFWNCFRVDSSVGIARKLGASGTCTCLVRFCTVDITARKIQFWGYRILSWCLSNVAIFASKAAARVAWAWAILLTVTTTPPLGALPTSVRVTCGDTQIWLGE